MALLCPGRSASAETSLELPSVLTITKSSNRNQVDYALRVDAACAPLGTAPVRPYWRMLERSPSATEGLSDREANVLGVLRQSVDGHRLKLALRGFPERTMIVETRRGADGTCSSQATMTIAGVAARIAGVFVNQTFFGGVKYVLLTGWAPDGSAVRERIAR